MDLQQCENPNKTRMREGVQKSAMFLLYLTKGVFLRPYCRDVEMFEAVRCCKPFVMPVQKGEFEFKMEQKEAEFQLPVLHLL